jgi:hypothetical protein
MEEEEEVWMGVATTMRQKKLNRSFPSPRDCAMDFVPAPLHSPFTFDFSLV